MYYCSAWLKRRKSHVVCLYSLSNGWLNSEFIYFYVGECLMSMLCLFMLRATLLSLGIVGGLSPHLFRLLSHSHSHIKQITPLIYFFSRLLCIIFSTRNKRTFIGLMAIWPSMVTNLLSEMLYTLKIWLKVSREWLQKKYPNTEIFFTLQPNVCKNLIHSIWHEINHF